MCIVAQKNTKTNKRRLNIKLDEAKFQHSKLMPGCQPAQLAAPYESPPKKDTAAPLTTNHTVHLLYRTRICDRLNMILAGWAAVGKNAVDNKHAFVVFRLMPVHKHKTQHKRDL